MATGKTRLALHWKILIGLVLGIVVGLAVNTMWTAATWDGMGVDHPTAFVGMKEAEVPVLPDGVDRVQDLDPDNPKLAGLHPYQLNQAQIEAFELATIEANQDPGPLAHVARFIRNLNKFVGALFMNGLKFIAVPIVLFSLAAGVASLNDISKVGRIGAKTVGIYLVTTAVAITIGLSAANLIRPGGGFDETLREDLRLSGEAEATAKVGSAEAQMDRGTWDVLLDIFPSNPFAAMADGNTLQVVVVGLLVGVALTLIPKKKAVPLIAFFDGMTDVIIKIVEIVLILAPYAVFALLVDKLADLGIDLLKQLAWYCMTVVLGLALMMFVVYPAVLRLLTPVRYGRFFKAISPAQLLAFSSSSSGATMPVTMECVEKRLGVSEDVTSFVIPVGATINMDGTALYQGVAAVFISQMYGMDLSFGQQLTIVLTATLASIGTAAVPGVGIVMLVIVLEAVGLPLEGIAVILGVDRILDMCRTSVNVTGDCMVASVVAHSEKELATEDEIAERLAREEAEGLDEHPHEAGTDQYGAGR
ncbi:MAG: dicarboxylate/amino acid:cation symporter [Planctomycetota bacterium]|nr:MAG: dicarboxylate/amino acid:cation symporter [Planctomycetota bacterium]